MMQRILTNYQVEWLSNIQLLVNYSDSAFDKNQNAEK